MTNAGTAAGKDRWKAFLPANTLRFKVASTAILISLVGISVAAFITKPLLETNLRQEFNLSRQEVTEYVALNAAGAMRWKKADIVGGSFASQLSRKSKPIAAAVAVTTDGEVLFKYAPSAHESHNLIALVEDIRSGKVESFKPHYIGNKLLTLAVSGRDKQGEPHGYVAVAWNTNVIDDYVSEAFTSIGVALSLSMLAVVLAMFFVVTWLVTNPLTLIANRIQSFAESDTDSPVPHVERHDEIGKIARSVSTMLEAEISLSKSSKDQADLVENVGKILGELAGGNLEVRLEQEVAPEFEKLKSDLNTAIGTLGQTIIAVAGSCTQISAETNGISKSINELSSRTERQAASLEETSESLNQITSLIKQTAESSLRVSDAVSQAKIGAEEGGEIVRNATEAMAGIETSSKQISQIIRVIDEIAFQTNLLALNAGVEAARAGDAGRGFAVVASEVRSLAQRSADAAMEIKELITSSTEHVEGGVQLVASTGAALDNIVAEVTEIHSVVAQISQSAQEQADSLLQVNAAMKDIDRNTQQNTVMAQEATAVSHTLASETQGLMALVKMFKVGEGKSVIFANEQSAVAVPAAGSGDRKASKINGSLNGGTPVIACGETEQSGAAWEQF